MGTTYTAYGLVLDASFPLMGVARVARDMPPDVSIELTTPTRLSGTWSGSDSAPAWTTATGGRRLVLERGRAGDLLFTYDGGTRFRLDASGRRLACAPKERGLDWERVLLTKVLSAVSMLRGNEALHASAVASPQGTVAIAAPSGTGKTTLALALTQRGWPLLADDVLVLDDQQGRVLAHPATGHVNVECGGAELSPQIGRDLGVRDGERWLEVADTASAALPLRLVCLLERAPGLKLNAEVLEPQPLALAPYMLGFPGVREHERRRFNLYADLASSVPLVRLTAASEDPPCDLADLLASTLALTGSHRDPQASR